MDRIRDSMNSLRIQDSRHELLKHPRVHPKDCKFPLVSATDQNILDQEVSTASLLRAFFTLDDTQPKHESSRFGHALFSAPSNRAIISACSSCSPRNASARRSSSSASSLSSVGTHDSSPHRDTVFLSGRNQSSKKVSLSRNYREPLYENSDKLPVVKNLEGGKAFPNGQQVNNENELVGWVKDDLEKEKRQGDKDRETRKGKRRTRFCTKAKSIITQAGSTSSDLQNTSVQRTCEEDSPKTTETHSDLVSCQSPNTPITQNHKLESLSSTTRPNMAAQTGSVSLEDATGWEDDSDSEDHSKLFQSHLSYFLEGPPGTQISRLQTELLSMKSRLTEKLMLDFRGIFDGSWPQGIRQHSSSGQFTIGTTISEFGVTSRDSSSVGYGKRDRSDDGEEDESDDNDERRRKRAPVNKLPAVPEDESLARQFACPFRKHDPRKYSIQKWPRCAEKPQKTIARLKGHLYIYHLIEQCTRCKLVFETGELLEAHSMGQGCEARMDQQVDGMTKKMKEQIQNKSRRQTDGEKWEQIYKILFPNEAVPDPYFETVTDLEKFPGSVNTAHYEAYLRRVLPEYVRNALEAAINVELQPIDAQLQRRMIDIIQEAQNQAFISFHDTREALSRPSELHTYMTLANDQSRANIETFFKAFPPANSTSFSELIDLRIPQRNGERNEFSDPGYGSRPSLSTHSQHDSSEMLGHGMIPSSSNRDQNGVTFDSDVPMDPSTFDGTHLPSFDRIDGFPSMDGNSRYPNVDIGNINFL